MADATGQTATERGVGRVFRASRLTRGNFLFPTAIEVTGTFVIRRKRTWFTRNEISMHLRHVASVRINTGILWSDILIESSGGTDPIASHGHTKGDAVEIKRLIELSQHSPAAGGGTRPCPFCAEPIQPAARICRFCNREVAPLV